MGIYRISVLLDLKECLVEDLHLIAREKSFKQMIDYEGIPFRCKNVISRAIMKAISIFHFMKS